MCTKMHIQTDTLKQLILIIWVKLPFFLKIKIML